MRTLKIVAFSALLGVAFSSCNKQFADYEKNENKPAQVPPGLVLANILSDVNLYKPWSDVTRLNQFDACNYNYYGDQRYDNKVANLGDYYLLENVVKMENEAIRLGGGKVNPYSAIGKFFKAFGYYRMSSLVGDLPMTEALKGQDNLRPAYDEQRKIFLQILQWLDESNNDLDQLINNPDKSNTSPGQTLSNDYTYANRLESWRKLVNTFRLRVLIALSKKEADADLKVAQQFQTILSNPVKYPLMESVQDNFQYIYNNINKYPSNPSNLGNDATRYNMTAAYLNTLVSLKDPRAYVTAEPATGQLRQGKTPADITAYVGAASGESLEDMSSKMSDVNNAAYSVRSRTRYYSSNAAEPGVFVGYAELCFNIAEAINRKWATGDAEQWYKRGIKASLTFYGIPVNGAGQIKKTYPYDSKDAKDTYTIPFDFDGVYYAQETVKYKGDNADGLKQILTQKYLAFFQGSDWEGYLNWRRTGVPAFSAGPGTGNNGRIPVRFRYPDNHRASNEDNWKAALQRQFGSGIDDINGVIWLIK